MPVSFLIVVAVLLLFHAAAGPAIGAASAQGTSAQTGGSDRVPARSPTSTKYIYDKAGALSPQQVERHQFDLDRLHKAGVPVVIYIHRSDDSRTEAVAFAERLRKEWKLESAPGADDGIVMLVSLGESSPLRSTLVMSTGRNALPIGQLDADTLHKIYDQEMQPAFRKKDVNLALSFGVRRILYYQGYTPPDPPTLSNNQRMARARAPWPAALAALVLVCGPLLSRRRSASGRRLPLARLQRFFPIIPAALLAISAAMALYGRSASWLAVAVVGGLLLALGTRLAMALRERRARGQGVVRVRTRGRRSGPRAVLTHRKPGGLRDA